MEYRAIGNFCAVNFNKPRLPIANEEALNILAEKGFKITEVDLVALAKEQVGKASWKLNSRVEEAPFCFDCSSLIKWLFSQRGIWLPRRSRRQYEFCRKHGLDLELDEAAPGDLIFVSSPYARGVFTGDHSGIGHVCLVSGPARIICATNSELGQGVVALEFEQLLATRKLRGVSRIISADDVTSLIPPHGDMVTADNTKRIILQSL